METPTQVLVHNDILGLKGAAATLLFVSQHGFYEVNLQFGGRHHRALLPIARTVVISWQPEELPGLEPDDPSVLFVAGMIHRLDGL